jgi:hypothetical protein|nr:MAG TPA: hypothetical protein [Caudoviricetes sp.]
MDFQYKIDRVNALYDEIDRLESKYETYEEINHEDAVKIIRMHALARNMIIYLIKKGVW